MLRGPDAPGDRVFIGKGRKAWRVFGAIAPALAPRRRDEHGSNRKGLWTPPEVF